MTLHGLENLKAVIFDYGNTLVEFTHHHLNRCDAVLAKVLEKWYGHVDHAKLAKIRDHDRVAPYQGEFVENDLPSITSSLVHSLYGNQPTADLLEELLEARFEGFLSQIEAPTYLRGVLDQIAPNYKIGLLSNYPCGNTIRTSLKNIGIDDIFHGIVVSADIGHVKPHPIVFNAILDQLNTKAEECLFIGDNWLGDIQGAKRIGMKAAHIVQFDTPEKFDPQPDDHQPDATISHLADTLKLLGIS